MAKRKNYFLPYVRQGLTTLADHSRLKGRRMVIPVELEVASDKVSKKTVLKKDITLYGPGDVLGINRKVISRLSPAPNTTSFEPNLTPFIEFTEPDFLWRFSSRTTTDKKNWIPWLALILLKVNEGEEEGEFVELESDSKELPARIELKSNAVLPDLRELWRWAHVHIQEVESSAEQIKNKIKRRPQKAVCRLLCPRKLKPETKYKAFLIPTHKIGAETGLGIKNGTDDRRLLVWDNPKNAAGMIVPYYRSWGFRTDTKGDFEYLVRQLVPRELKNMGTQIIDGSRPGYGIHSEGFKMNLEAALKSIDVNYHNWGEGEKSVVETKIQNDLARLLNKRQETVEGEIKLRVTPPIYGMWHSTEEEGQVKVDTMRKHQWIEEINLDFRHRAAAGLGVQFVKQNQEQLMQAAWEQLSKVKKVNRRLNMGRFGREVSMSLYKRLVQVEPQTLLRLAMPLKNKLVADETMIKSGSRRTSSRMKSGPSPKFDKTINALLQEADVALNLTRNKMNKYIAQKARVKHVQSFEPIVSSQILSRDFKPAGLETKKKKSPRIIKQGFKNKSSWFKVFGVKVSGLLNPKNTIENKLKTKVSSFRVLERHEAPKLQTAVADPLRPVIWHPEFHQSTYHFLRDISQSFILPGIENVAQNTVALLQTNRRFIEAFMVGLNHEFASELRWREFPTDMRGSYFRSFWDTSIYSLDEKEKEQFRSQSIGKKLLDLVKSKFPGHNFDWVKIESAYVKGEPNEVEAEVADMYESAVEKWLLTRNEDKDIDRLVNWKLNTRLGSHLVPKKGNMSKGDPNQLVLLIKGELLQKFGNTLIYLVEKKEVGGTRKPNMNKSSRRIFPVFEGAMPPDIVFIGFDIKPKDTDKYFLVFEERATDLRFGLDINADGEGEEDLSWEHFEKIEEGDYINKQQPRILTDKWNSASYISKVMLQKQVRVAIELERMLP